MSLKSIPVLLIYSLLFTLCGCANLATVKQFSTDTLTLTDALDLIVKDGGASCLRRLSLDAPIRGYNDEKRKEQAAVCDALKQDSAAFLVLNNTTRAYGQVLGQLADNKLVTFSAEVSGVQGAISTLQNSGVDASQLNGASAIANLVLHAATDAYRQREIKRVLDHHDDLVQLAGVLQTYLQRAYLPALDNEAGNLENLHDLLTERYLKIEPLRSRELLEILLQQRASLAERTNTAHSALAALSKMLETHQQLRQNADPLDNKDLAQFLNDYGKQIQNVRTQINAAF